MKRLWWGVPAIAVLIGVLTAVGILSAYSPEDEVESQNPEVTILGPFPRPELEQKLQSAGVQTGVDFSALGDDITINSVSALWDGELWTVMVNYDPTESIERDRRQRLEGQQISP
jgi:hypothetical protein